jgi:hypothetical protein
MISIIIIIYSHNYNSKLFFYYYISTAFIFFANKWINSNNKFIKHFNNYNKDSNEKLTFFGN